MASSSDARPKCSVKHCSKCKGPVWGHTGTHGALCRHPSPQFVNDVDVPELANIHHHIEASMRAHQDQTNNLTAELQMLDLGSSTPLFTASMPQQNFDGVPVINFYYSTCSKHHMVNWVWCQPSFRSSSSSSLGNLIFNHYHNITGLTFTSWRCWLSSVTGFSKQELD